ncbi:MAG: hypothetical protein HEP71_06680 [Roseivirga sp.]|nr:hypothetical protein [Roseivirga sp.]
MKKFRFLILFLLAVISFNARAQNIFRTACGGNLVRLDSLLSGNALDTIDNRGRSLLHWAVACNRPEVVNFLIDKDIETGLEDGDGVTPLHMTVRYNRPLLFERLIALPGNQGWTGQYGAAMLETAILRKNLPFVKKLTENGVAIDIRNDRGSTPLEIATRTGTKEIADWLITQGADKNLVRIIQPIGAYMGQKTPGMIRQLFAPNFISTEESEFGSVFNAAATEFYYAVDVNGKNEIRYSRLVNNQWSQPEIILSHERYSYNDPFLSPDEQRLYFISRRPINGTERQEYHDIWYVEKTEDGWSEPINAGSNINSEASEFYISFTNEGTMYFSSSVNAPAERRRSDLDIYSSKFVNGVFQKPVSLGVPVNTADYEADVFVSPDESYIIFCGIKEEGLGRGDLYISFKKPDGSWTTAVNMSDKINTTGHELCPFVTADGKYLFYTSNQDIYWVDARVIEEFRN